ncbi:MAG: BCCT family transporter [Gammaproteobacteria bacterium]|nr:BCCT family transporter [Gammaproteobacteria bacterium]
MSEPNRSRHAQGEQNLRFLGFDVHGPVFFASAALLLAILAWVIAYPAAATEFFAEALTFVTTRAGGLMGALGNLFVLFCIFLIVSPYGSVRLGGPQAKPEFSNLSWFAMLFAAGMGIGLVFYSVAEPLSHFSSSMAATSVEAAAAAPLGGAPGDAQASARLAMSATIFHWTLHPWSIFAVVAVGMALFTYNHGLPLTIRSSLYPLFGERIWGPIGHLIDGLAIVATVAGLATSLGLGAQQALAGMTYLFGVEFSPLNQILLIVGIAVVTTTSVVLGLERGVKWLSLINVGLAAALCAFVMIAGPTASIIAGLGQNVAALARELPQLMSVSGRTDGSFFRDWTIFYWSWWTAWAPFVGMFIARISLGRTVRETVFYVVLLPSIVSVIWFTAFGALAIEQVVAGTNPALVTSDLPLKLFVALRELPLAEISCFIGILLVMIFFVTSWDSGTLVLDSLSAGGKTETPKLQAVFWILVVGAAAVALLLGGGLRSLQSGSVVTGLPFMIVITLICVGTLRGLAQARRAQSGTA